MCVKQCQISAGTKGFETMVEVNFPLDNILKEKET